MKTLLPILKTKLFLLSFISACTVILATTVPQIRNFIAPEKAIGEKIVTEQKKIAPKTKKQNKTVSDSRVTSGLSLEMNNSFEATVTTDLQDYPPGATVNISGSGWTPGEQVKLQVLHILADGDNDSSPAHQPWYVTADSLGNITSTWLVPFDEDELWATLILTADGQASVLHAETTFTDAPTITVDAIPSSACAGGSITVDYSTSAGGNAPLTPLTAQLSNSSGSFSSPISLSPTTSITGNNKSMIVTIPINSAQGSGYKIRIISSDATPVTAASSTTITINALPNDPGNPTSNSPQCADVGVTLTRSGTPPVGEIWYWQTTPTGTNTANSGTTFNATSSGTYYIRSQSAAGCWSNGAGSLAVVVNPLPANPSNPTSNSPQCSDVGVTLTRSGTPPAGVTWYWQTTPTGTSTANSGTTFNVNTSGTYYIRAQNNTTLCWSSGAGSLAAVVNPLPTDPGDPTSNSPQCADIGVTLTRIGSPAGGITWYWQTIPTGTSTANSGTTFNVTTSGTYYIRAQNNATLCWSSGAGSLAVAVNPLPATPGTPTSNSPQCTDVGVTLTRNGTAPAGETWYWQTTPTGTSTANSGATFNVNTSGTYYIRSQNNTTLCWSTAASLAVTVNPLPANPGNPTSNSPQCEDVGVTLTRSGTPPAGITWYWQTTPTGTSTANSGTTFNVNTSGTYYIRAQNNTTLCWSSGAGSLAVVVNPLPADPDDPTSNSPQCSDVGVTLTRSGTPPAGETWYWQTTPTGTSTANSGTTFNAATSGTYYIRSRNNATLCWSSGSGSLAVVVNPLPANPGNPTSNSPQCADAGVTLTRSGIPPAGVTWYWQTSATGTSTANSGTTFNVNTSGTYYIRAQNNTTLCWSSGAGSLAVVINPLPADPGNPTSNSPQCADAGVTLTRNGTPPAGETWYWQTTPTGTSTANSGITFTVNASGTYYIRSRNNTTLCWSSGAGSLAVVVNPLPATPGTPTSNSPQCADAGVTLTRNGTAPAGETWYWQTSATGTSTANSGATFNVNTSGTYYIRSQNNTTLCWSIAASLAVTVNPNPTAPTGGGTVIVCQNATPATLTVTPPGGSTIDWYDAASGGTLLQSGSNSYQTSIANIYYAESRNTTTGCKSLTRTAVTLVINPNPGTFNVSFTGSLCGTAVVTLDGSEIGVNYTLFKNATNVETVAGTGNSISFAGVTQTGTYTVVATNTTTTCQSTMNGTVVMAGGTPPTNTFSVTGGGTYCTGGAGLPVGLDDTETGVSYQLFLDETTPVGSPVAGTGSAISFGNQTAAGTYKVVGTKTSGSGCSASMNGTVDIIIVPQPVGPTLSTQSPTNATICAGTTVSATFNAGSGGTGCSDDYTVSIDGGAAVAYTPGSSVGGTATSSIVIKGRRANCAVGSSCTGTSYTTLASWTVVPQPIAPTLNVKSPTNATICTGTTVSATFNAGSGGTGCSDDYTVSIDGGAAVAYTPGSSVGGTATSSIVIKGRRANCDAGSGCTGTSYVTLASWNVVAQPVGPTLNTQSPTNATICTGTTVSATFTTGSGGTGCTDDYVVSIDGGADVAYTPNAAVGGTATTSIVIKGRRANCTSGSGCNGTSYTTLASWTVVAQPSSPTLLAKLPTNATICTGTTVSATFNAGSGGTGCSDDYTVSIDGGAAVAYTPGSSVGGSATSSIIIKGRRANCDAGSGCTGTAYVILASWSVVAQPVGPTLNTQSPTNATICTGTAVSATFTAGSGGTGCSDDYTVSIDGGAAVAYTPGSSVGGSAATSIVIKGRRANCDAGSGCTGTSYVTLASWNVVAQPVGPTLNTQSPTNATICSGTTVSATFTAGSGGTGCSDDYILIIDGGAPSAYTAGSSVGGTAATSIVIKGRRANCDAGSGCTGTAYVILASWNVVAQPVGPTLNTQSPTNATICTGTTVSATFTAGSGGTGCSDDYTVSIDGGAAVAYTPGSSVGGGATSSIVIKGRRANCDAGSGCTGTGYVTLASWNVVAQPVGPTLNIQSPTNATICTGTTVSATFTAGSGGTGCSDDYIVIIDGGAPSAYTAGSSVGGSAATSIVIKGRRANCDAGSGCTGTSYVTLASWNVVTQPVGPTLDTQSPTNATICTGTTVSATFTAGSGGTGCSDDYTVSIDGGAAVAYTPGSSVGGSATSSIVIKGRRANCDAGSGCTGTSYVTLASWSVVTQPTGPTLLAKTPNTAAVCDGDLVSATFTAGSGGTGCSDDYRYSINNGSTWFAYTSGTNINTTGGTTILIQGRRANCAAGSGCNGTIYVTLASWAVNALPNNASGGLTGNTICFGETGQLTFDAINATFVMPYTIEYKETTGSTIWQQVIASASATSFNVAVNPTTTTNYTLVSITNGNGCVRTTGFGDATAQIMVNQLPTITLGSIAAICKGTTTANLPYSATTNGANQYSIDFNAAAEAESFVDITNAVLAIAPGNIAIVVPAGVTPGTYSAVLTVRNSSTTCVSNPTYNISVTIDGNPIVTTVNACKDGSTVAFTQAGGTLSGTWSVSGGGTIVPSTGIFTPTTEGCFTATYTTPNAGCFDTKSFVVFPAAPVLIAPANTCNAAFTLPTVTPKTGFNVHYSINGGSYSASPTIPTAPGCYTVKAKYVLGADCGGTLAGAGAPAGCLESNTVSVVIFPAAPTVAPMINTCNSTALANITAITPVAGFTAEYAVKAPGGVYSSFGTLVAANALLTNTPGCWSVKARYKLTGACGLTSAGATGSGACGESTEVNAVVFPAPPLISAPANTCNAAFTLPTVTPVPGFTVEYNINYSGWYAAPTVPTTPGCYTIHAKYVLVQTCGSTLAGSDGPIFIDEEDEPVPVIGGCTVSTPVNVVIFPAAPSAPVVTNTCNAALTIPALSVVSGFTAEYSFNNGSNWSTSNVSASSTPGCYSMKTRYVLTSACGTNGAGTTAPAACAASATGNAVIFPAAPIVTAISNTCNTKLADITAVTPVTGFTAQYAVKAPGGSYSSFGTLAAANALLTNTPGCWSVKARYILTDACGSTLASATSSGACGESAEVNAVVFPAAPIVTAISNTCNTKLADITAVTPVAGFTAQYAVKAPGGSYSSFGTLAAANASLTNTPGCWSVKARYILTDACGSTLASATSSAACGESAEVNAVVFPAAPIVTAISNTCNTKLADITAVTPVTGFTAQYAVKAPGGSYSSFGTLAAANALLTNTPGCWSVKARYILAYTCGSTTAGTTSSATCGESAEVNAVVFPAAPIVTAISNTCNTKLADITAVTPVAGFTAEYAVKAPGGSYSSFGTLAAANALLTNTPGCWSVKARYILADACGSTLASATSSGACGESAEVNAVVFPAAPIVTAISNTCNTKLADITTVTPVAGFTAQYAVKAPGGSYSSFGTLAAANALLTNTSGCWSVKARYILTDACGSTLASATSSAACGESAEVNAVVFPAAPIVTAISNTCNTKLADITAVTPVTGFTAQYAVKAPGGSYSSFGTLTAANALLTNTPGCWSVKARYILTDACGSTLASATSSAACGESAEVNAVVFPAAPIVTAISNTCNTKLADITAVTPVAGFTAQYAAKAPGGSYSSFGTLGAANALLTNTPGCWSVKARYILTDACGSTLASATSSAACGESAEVNAVVFPAAPIVTAISNTCNTKLADITAVTPVTGFTAQYAVKAPGGSYSSFGTLAATNGLLTNTAGCWSVKARYILAYTCGSTTAGTTSNGACGESGEVNAVVFPAAPLAPTVNATCGPIVVTAPASVTGFNIEYSFDDGTTWGANTPPTADNCTGYKIRTRYVLASSCGATVAGTPGPGACTTSPATTRKVDNTAPTPICQNITVQLNASGTVTIYPSQVNNGSNDNCGSVTLALDKTSFNCSNLGANTVKLTVTDACNNTSSCSATVTVQDNIVPTITCPADITCGTDPGSCSKTLTLAQIGTATPGDNCGATVTWTRSDAAGTLTAPYAFGGTIITWKATDATGNTATCQQTININKVNTVTTFTVSTTPSTNPVTQQYSDKVTFVATVTPYNCLIAGNVGGTVTFKIGTLTMGTASVINGVATLADVQLLEPTLSPNTPPNGPLGPIPSMGSVTKTATAEFTGTGINFNVSNPGSASIKITQEDARVDYIGDEIKAAATATTTTVPVVLKALVMDISLPQTPPDPNYDANPGDIRNARVKFVNRETNTDISGWLTPALVTADTRSGTVSFPYTINLGTANSVSLTVGIIVDNGYYYRDNTTDNTVVTGYKPVGDFITGGGYIIPTMSMGTMASDPGRKTNFGFNVKFNKSGTNLQGQMNFIIRRTQPDNIVHVYQFKSNAMLELGVNITNPNSATANFVSKCNLTDITNPNAPISMGGNKYMYVKMVDNGEPGLNDIISFAVVEGNDDPAILANLLYSSNWITNQTVQMNLGGGNLVVHSGFNMNQTSSNNNTITKSQQMEVAPVVALFNVKAFPNPSADEFSLYLEGANNDKVHIVVYDAMGREVKKFEKEGGNIPIIFGRDLKGGAYFVEVRQGENHKTIRLIKQN